MSERSRREEHDTCLRSSMRVDAPTARRNVDASILSAKEGAVHATLSNCDTTSTGSVAAWSDGCTLAVAISSVMVAILNLTIVLNKAFSKPVRLHINMKSAWRDAMCDCLKVLLMDSNQSAIRDLERNRRGDTPSIPLPG